MPKSKALEPIRVQPDALDQKSEWIASRDTLLERAREIKAVDSDKDLNAASDVQTQAGKLIKDLEKERKGITGPLDTIKKHIMAREKELRADLESERFRLKKLNDAYATKLAREREEEERRRREAEERERLAQAERQAETEALFGEGAVAKEEEAEPVEPEPEKPRLSNARTVTRWDFRVAEPDKVPREYTSPDESKIRAAINYQVKLGKTPEIPGVEITKRESVEGR